MSFNYFYSLLQRPTSCQIFHDGHVDLRPTSFRDLRLYFTYTIRNQKESYRHIVWSWYPCCDGAFVIREYKISCQSNYSYIRSWYIRTTRGHEKVFVYLWYMLLASASVGFFFPGRTIERSLEWGIRSYRARYYIPLWRNARRFSVSCQCELIRGILAGDLIHHCQTSSGARHIPGIDSGGLLSKLAWLRSIRKFSGQIQFHAEVSSGLAVFI